MSLAPADSPALESRHVRAMQHEIVGEGLWRAAVVAAGSLWPIADGASSDVRKRRIGCWR